MIPFLKNANENAIIVFLTLLQKKKTQSKKTKKNPSKPKTENKGRIL